MSRKERKLTPAERRRKEHFEESKRRMQKEGYQLHDLTISISYANLMALVLSLPIIIVLGMMFFWVNPEGSGSLSGGRFFLFLAAFLVLVFIHELIHGLTWMIFAQDHWNAISFGFMLQSLTPYCSCEQPLGRKAYVLGALMPTLILGILPAAAAIVTGLYPVLWMSAMMILAGGGDLAIILKVLRFRSDKKEGKCLDHPYEAGLVIFTR